MGKSDINLLDSLLASGITGKKIMETAEEVPPKIPPRMKKKGPDLPEKPPHMRPKNSTTSSHEDLLVVKAPFKNQSVEDFWSTKNQRIGVNEKELLVAKAPVKIQPSVDFWLTNSHTQRSVANEREVLVAASRAGRERPIEKRQREPAKLLAPTSGASTEIVPRKSTPINKSSSKKTDFHITSSTLMPSRKQQPMMLIPRGFLVDTRGSVLNPHAWGSTPVLSYSLWTQQRGFKPNQNHKETKLTPILTSSTSVKTRSSSVTRSGSLTSQGSSSSDSGNETFPKSVLKKHKRNSGGSLNPKTTHKTEQKKNVTFNAFATVQLMEE